MYFLDQLYAALLLDKYRDNNQVEDKGDQDDNQSDQDDNHSDVDDGQSDEDGNQSDEGKEETKTDYSQLIGESSQNVFKPKL